MNELDIVVLTKDLPEESLLAGDVGTIVSVYKGKCGYEVEFTNYAGDTLCVATVPAEAVRPVKSSDIKHVRDASVELVAG